MLLKSGQERPNPTGVMIIAEDTPKARRISEILCKFPRRRRRRKELRKEEPQRDGLQFKGRFVLSRPVGKMGGQKALSKEPQSRQKLALSKMVEKEQQFYEWEEIEKFAFSSWLDISDENQ